MIAIEETVAADYRDFISNISFRSIGPKTRLSPFSANTIRGLARLGLSIEMWNTKLPADDQSTKRNLRHLCKIPKMSSFAIGCIINRGVSQMSAKHAFVNVGVWNGFTFFCGMNNNAHKKCIGIDNFSNSKAARTRRNFLRRFNEYKSANHFFHEMNYLDYFASVHKEQIGFYIYDGKHNYDNQLQGLKLAEPFLAKNCIIMIDDTNAEEPRRATADFIAGSSSRYETLLDETTTGDRHPTFWNGIMILQKVD
jgi:hypothetical protein